MGQYCPLVVKTRLTTLVVLKKVPNKVRSTQPEHRRIAQRQQGLKLTDKETVFILKFIKNEK